MCVWDGLAGRLANKSKCNGAIDLSVLYCAPYVLIFVPMPKIMHGITRSRFRLLLCSNGAYKQTLIYIYLFFRDYLFSALTIHEMECNSPSAFGELAQINLARH